MRVKNIISRSIVGAVIVSALSFFIKIIPCKGDEKWSLCTLPNPFEDTTTITQKFYGMTADPLTALVFQFIIAFAIIFLILTGFRKKARDVAHK